MSASHVWVISGPSAVGKGTVCARLQELHPEPYYSISMTTRPPRTGEVDGESYHFVDVERFRALIEAGDLLEWAVVHGKHRYGTPQDPVMRAVEEGRRVILEIDLQGARQVRRHVPDARFVFLAPPSWEALVDRLIGRGTETAEQQARRLETAKQELAAEAEFDHTVVNAQVDRTVDELVSLLGL